ncbi:de-hypoxanthine futalosine cyclase [Hazenella coriacea]|uniref:De-hypoxanthine futalosine cyclase n=2 Tax=Hazenella coriacea TaxID=1179467 RepID=A0A4R3LCA6_9BACL|nr:de-hypoxanthine futalosine cyclase [Hazenella coriacea]
MKSNDLLTIGKMADTIRKRKNGERVHFIVNTHLHYTNVCYLNCNLCAFGLKPDHPHSYTLSLEKIEEHSKQISEQPFTELQIVGGVNAKLPFSYYEKMVRTVKRYNPDIHVQAFTAVELDYLARTSRMSVQETILRLRDAGLDSILGGGAEIFDPDVRKVISGHKTNSDRWFEIHEVTHNLGIKSNASILYGHIEKPEHVIDHLIRIRDHQDRTQGFQAFSAYAFQPDNTKLSEIFNLQGKQTTGLYDLKILAVARLMLDNFPHIHALWGMIGLKLAQVSLQFGVDDLGGIVKEEAIAYSGGHKTSGMTSKQEFIDIIKEMGRIPIERDTFYKEIQRFE